MSDIEKTTTALADSLLNKVSSKLNETAADRIERFRTQTKKTSSLLNYDNISSKLNESAADKIERLRKQTENIQSVLEYNTNSYKLNEALSDKIESVRNKIGEIPSILDYDTLSKLKNGEYEISLKEYTTMSAYNAKMTALYGNNSASPFQKNLNTILGTDDDSLANAKNFVEKMKENGLSNSSAVKLYSAIKSYSILSSFNNYNFVKATV